jgi:ABC-2 type transport system permease protein
MADKLQKRKMNKQMAWLQEMIRFNIKSVLEYKSVFLIQVIGMMINNTGFIAVWFFFFKIFDSINGWGFKEMIGLNGFVALIYGITLALGNGIRKISRNVTYGQFDKFLVLPKNVLLNAIFSESHISAIGDFFFGIISLVIYFIMSGLGIREGILLLPLIIFALMVFCGFIITVQSLVFWIPNSDELSSALFEFMLGPSLYPNSSFSGVVRVFFTFFVPAIIIGGLPVNILLHLKLLDILLLILLGCFWVIFSVFIFYRGLRRYESGNLVGIR